MQLAIRLGHRTGSGLQPAGLQDAERQAALPPPDPPDHETDLTCARA
jgi:hypothetical protein